VLGLKGDKKSWRSGKRTEIEGVSEQEYDTKRNENISRPERRIQIEEHDYKRCYEDRMMK
jgi:hypothetical protein